MRNQTNNKGERKMKVLLISPPFPANLRKERLRSGYVLPPLGLAYLAGALENHGHVVSILDAWTLDLTQQAVIKKVNDKKPDIVGITCDISRIDVTIEIANKVKQLRRNIGIIVGGPFATIRPDYLLKRAEIDAIAIGESEHTVLELIPALQDKRQLHRVKGIVFNDNGDIIRTPPQPLIADLDTIPFPAFHLLPMSHYSYVEALRRPTAAMVTSRGCPFRCGFCEVPRIWGRKYRYHSAERIVAEIEFLQEKWNIKAIRFNDSEFLLNKDRIIKLCELILKKGIKVEWSCETRVDTIDDIEFLRTIKKAGCNSIIIGVESGNQKILDRINKNITLEQSSMAIRNCKKVGIRTSAFFMIGLPGETYETVVETIKFAKKLDPDYVFWNTYTPFPDTPLWDYYTERGLINEDQIDWSSFNLASHSPTIQENLTFEELQHLSKVARTEFMKPVYIVRRIGRCKSFQEFKSLIKVGLKRIEWFFRD